MTKPGIASRSPTALYSEARGRLTDTLEERGVPPCGTGGPPAVAYQYPRWRLSSARHTAGA